MRHAKTSALIETAREILEDHHPMTVRQCYYQLVSRQVIENNRSAYQAVSKALVAARKEGLILWEWIEDRLRKPRHVSMWSDLSDYAGDVKEWYRKDVWATQPRRVEVWLEKDALSGIFDDVLRPYGVTLNVGRGFDGWDSIHNAAERFGEGVVVLYYGDFDPSGECMVDSLRTRLAELGCHPEIIKCALIPEDIKRHNLPPDFAKKTDSRSAAFIAKHGDVSVELDALPADVLAERLEDDVRSRMDLEALALVKQQENTERNRLRTLMEGAV